MCYNYLYRSIDDYGVGHLCSVDWDISGDNRWVKTEFIPSYETPDVEAVPRDKNEYVECKRQKCKKYEKCAMANGYPYTRKNGTQTQQYKCKICKKTFTQPINKNAEE